MCSPASAILTSIVTILVSFEAILRRFSVRINFKSQFQSNDLPQALKYIKIASKLTSIVTILRVLHLQVNTFVKYWVNICEYYHNTYEYCHNTCQYWAGEYTLRKNLPSITFTTQLAAPVRVPCMQRSGKGLALEWCVGHITLI